MLLIDEDLTTFLYTTSYLSMIYDLSSISLSVERSLITDVCTSVKDILQPVCSFISPLSFVIGATEILPHFNS